MSLEPEKPIEKLLRATAKERRDQAGNPWELNPANRRLLQQEVARRWGKSRARSWSFAWLFGQGWLGPVGATAAIFALIVAGWFFASAPYRKEAAPLLAQNERPPAAIAEGSPEPPAPEQLAFNQAPPRERADRSKEILADKLNLTEQKQSSGAPARKSEAEKDAPSSRSASLAKAQPTVVPSAAREEAFAVDALDKNNVSPIVASQGIQFAPQPAATATQVPTADAAIQNSTDNERAAASDSSKLITPPVAAAAPAESQLAATTASSAQNSATSDFVQYGYFAASQTSRQDTGRVQQLSETKLKTPTKAAAPEQPRPSNQILRSFRIEQSGREITVIDSDGSVYSGPVQAGGTAFAGASAEGRSGFADNFGSAKRKAGALDSRDWKAAQASNAETAFQVIGTNRSSNQRVIFSGTLSGNVNRSGFVQTRSAEGGAGLLGGVSAENLPKSNFRVAGKVLIGQNREIQIDAVSVTSPPQNR
jgi:hypothetical protein